eukprot:7554901-Pyramimonas_sp.AAC.1
MKAWTAHGIDRLGPRDFFLLSDECLEALNLVWVWMLQQGILPSQISLTLQPALPKPDDDGHRLIARLSMTDRLWSKCTRHIASNWEQKHERSYIYGSKGRSCERAVWEQAFTAEHASLN